jgi:hypothetical protein
VALQKGCSGDFSKTLSVGPTADDVCKVIRIIIAKLHFFFFFFFFLNDLAHLLLVKYASITSSLTDVVSALPLFLTCMPATVVSSLLKGHSQSCTSLRATNYGASNGKVRLYSQTTLSIEAESAQVMKTYRLVECFAFAKVRVKKAFS